MSRKVIYLDENSNTSNNQGEIATDTQFEVKEQFGSGNHNSQQDNNNVDNINNNNVDNMNNNNNNNNNINNNSNNSNNNNNNTDSDNDDTTINNQDPDNSSDNDSDNETDSIVSGGGSINSSISNSSSVNTADILAVDPLYLRLTKFLETPTMEGGSKNNKNIAEILNDISSTLRNMNTTFDKFEKYLENMATK
jgi:hypothetical protein